MSSGKRQKKGAQAGGNFMTPAAASRAVSAARAYPSVTVIGGINIYSTDILLRNDVTMPNTSWASYFDSIARRYFYLQASTGTAQYEHPNLPVFSTSHSIIIDPTVYFLPPGWIKLQNTTPRLPYYLNVNSSEVSWHHPNPPPNPATLSRVTDTTLLPTYSKYIDPTTNKPFYVNTATKEAQWNFPDVGFNPGPSTAQAASSAVAQRDSSAQQQTVSSANFQRVTAATVSYRYFIFTIFSPRVPPDVSDPDNPVKSDSAISGLFLNRTNIPAPWRPAATAIAVDPVSLQQLTDADGAPITYTSGSPYGNIFDNSLTKKIYPVQPSGTYPVSILIDNTVPIMFNAYYFGLADLPNADVVQWSLQGSTDGRNFFMIDDQSAAPRTDLVPDIRNSFIPPIELNVSYKQGASSAIRQGVSSAVAQVASSALAQRASSAFAQRGMIAQQQEASSAQIQGASSAVAQTVSAALNRAESAAERQAASSAVQDNALAPALAIIKAVTAITSGLRSTILSSVKIIYSNKSTPAQVAQAQANLNTAKANLATQEAKLSAQYTIVLRIAPAYQDPSLQTVVSDPFIEAAGYTKRFDAMRKAYVIHDANGYIVPYPLTIESRGAVTPPQGQAGGSLLSVTDQLLSTDIPISGTPTIPANSPWSMYYDSMFGKYFYINVTANKFTYDHPNPPAFLATDPLVKDESVDQLPDGWVKHKGATNNLPYYYNYRTSEASWNHPKPPTRDSSLTPISDSVLDSSKFTKYMDPTTEQAYYVNNTTFETFWEFPDAGFNPGPSAAVRAVAESSAVAQTASSAVVETALAAKAAEAAAEVARAGFIKALDNENPDLALAAARSLVASVLASVDKMVAAGSIYPAITLLTDTIQILYKCKAYTNAIAAGAGPEEGNAANNAGNNTQAGGGPPGDSIFALIKKLKTRLKEIQTTNPDRAASAASAEAAEAQYRRDLTSTDPTTARNAIRRMVDSVVSHVRLLTSMGSYDEAETLITEAMSEIEGTPLYIAEDSIAVEQYGRLTQLKESINELSEAAEVADAELAEEEEEEKAAKAAKAAASKSGRKKPAGAETAGTPVLNPATGLPMINPATGMPMMNPAAMGAMPPMGMPGYGMGMGMPGMGMGMPGYGMGMGMPGMGMGMGMGMPMGMGSNGQPTIVLVPSNGNGQQGCCSSAPSCGCNSHSRNSSDPSNSRLLEATANLDKSVNSLKESVTDTSKKIDIMQAQASGANANNNNNNNNNDNDGNKNNNNNGGNNKSGNNGGNNNGGNNKSNTANDESMTGGSILGSVATAGIAAGTGVQPTDLTSIVTSLTDLTGAVKGMNETMGTIPGSLKEATDNMKATVDQSYADAVPKMVEASKQAAEDAVNGVSSSSANNSNTNNTSNNSGNNNSNNSGNNNSGNNNSGNNNSGNNNSGNNTYEGGRRRATPKKKHKSRRTSIRSR